MCLITHMLRIMGSHHWFRKEQLVTLTIGQYTQHVPLNLTVAMKLSLESSGIDRTLKWSQAPRNLKITNSGWVCSKITDFYPDI
ncbi:hypothetical protein QCA50_010703 [Cerrena zonata]|uniref:Uncharacterized protein n=1 Tax=Cerrena zonata TaxID=2478898 RepID=A0AAW0FY80_9APHY